MYAESTQRQTLEAIIGRNIAKRRAIVDLTQEELGAKIRRDRDFVKRLEAGQSVTIDIAFELQVALRLPDVFVLLKPDAFL